MRWVGEAKGCRPTFIRSLTAPSGKVSTKIPISATGTKQNRHFLIWHNKNLNSHGCVEGELKMVS